MSICRAILLALCLLTSRSPAQNEQQYSREADQLAGQLVSKLNEADKKGVLVVDLKGPEGRWLPFGEWLADQFSSSLANLGQQIEIVDRARLEEALSAQHLMPRDEFDLKNAIALSKAVGANTLILASYGAAENGLGVTLVAFRVAEYGIPHSSSFMITMIRGKLDLTQDLSAHLGAPLDSLRPSDGVAWAGLGGVTIPTCIKCVPPPRMSVPDIDLVGFLRDKRGVGTLQLRFIVTADGHTKEITVSKPLGYGFDEQYVKAAKDFEFKPAVDADNKLVPVHTHLDFTINTK